MKLPTELAGSRCDNTDAASPICGHDEPPNGSIAERGRAHRAANPARKARVGDARLRLEARAAWATHRHATPWSGGDRWVPACAACSGIGQPGPVEVRGSRLPARTDCGTLEAESSRSFARALRQPLPEAAATLAAQYTGRLFSRSLRASASPSPATVAPSVRRPRRLPRRPDGGSVA